MLTYADVCVTVLFPKQVRVARCKWALQAEDSLIEIAPRFQTNWLPLWYFNPFMAHPDHAASLTGKEQYSRLTSALLEPY